MTDVDNTIANGRLRPRRKTAAKIEPPRNLRSDLKVLDTAAIVCSTSASAVISNISDNILTNEKAEPFMPNLLCLYCERIFPGKKSLSKHVQRIHQCSTRKDYSIKCNFCNHVETETRHIINHMLESHSNQYFVCERCLQRFSSSQELSHHCSVSCNGEQQKVLPYRTKLRHKNNVTALTSIRKADAGKKGEISPNHLLVPELNVPCEMVKKDDIDFEESISMNLILPPCNNAYAGNVHEKRPVIVLDDIQWKRKPSNIEAIQSGDRTDQILSRLGVVHRSRGTETSRYWYRHIDESSKFERCFDTNFYLRVANNVQDNLLKFLDGTLNAIPKEDEPIKTRKSKNNVLINTIEGFPSLLAAGQFTRNTIDDLPRAIAPKQKWKWDNTDNDKQTATNDDLGIVKRDSHTNKCIVGLFSSLDMWTQVRMRHKHEETFKGSVAIEKLSASSKELREIIESRELPNTSTQIVKYTSRQLHSTEGIDFPISLGLVPSAPECEIQPAVLSGEWARKRCYVCCACGEQSQDSKSLSTHHSTHHPHAQVNNYEIVGEELLKADILKHLYVPPAPPIKKRLPLRGSKTCTKCDRHMMAEELHQHMLECAGDTPVPRRKVRQRPFGVRRRRTRLPENTIRKQLRKTIRTRRTRPKKIIRAHPRIRTPVGDAETIKKMIADLPAKRHRVSANQVNKSSRPASRHEKQIQMRLKRIPSENDTARNKVKLADIFADVNVQRKITRSKLTVKDTKGKGISGTQIPKNLVAKGKVLKIKITRKNVIRKSERKPRDNGQIGKNSVLIEEATVTEGASSYRSINVSSNFLDASPINHQSVITRSASGGNNTSSARRSDTSNESNSQSGRNTSHNPSGSKHTVPLKHSIASLTATTHVETYRAHPLVTIPRNIPLNSVSTNKDTYEEQRALIHDEAFAKKLDKPPLYPKSDEVISNLKSKSNKTRRGLNDCIAMLKGKLGENTCSDTNEGCTNLASCEKSLDLPSCNDTLLCKQNIPDSLIYSSPVNSIEMSNSLKPLDLSGKLPQSPPASMSIIIDLPTISIKPICLPPIQSEPLPLLTGPQKLVISTTAPSVVSSAAITTIVRPNPTVAAPAALGTVVSPTKSTTSITVPGNMSSKKSIENRRSSEKTFPKVGIIRSAEKTSNQRPVFDPTLRIPQYKVRQNTAQESEPKQLPTDSSVALLPKEIVEILGTMSAQHRNTLLNALPQVFAKTVKDLKLVVDSNITKESLTSPNKSEIATQTINSLLEQEFPQEFVNIDTNKYLIDPVTGTITERPEKEVLLPVSLESHASIKESPRLDVIDLTSEEEEQEKKVTDKSRIEFLPPTNPKTPEIDPALSVSHSSSTDNIQPLIHGIPSPAKIKSSNDKTSSLRAVRIKSANEKQKLLSANNIIPAHVSKTVDQLESNKNIIEIQNPSPTMMLTLETTVCAVNAGSMTSPAIQQAEISSTQQSSINAARSNHTSLGSSHTGLNDFKVLPVDNLKEKIDELEIIPTVPIHPSDFLSKKPMILEESTKLTKCDPLIKDIQDCTKGKQFIPATEPTTVLSSPPNTKQNRLETTHPAEKACIHPNEDLQESSKPEESQCNRLLDGPIIENKFKMTDENNTENKQTVDLGINASKVTSHTTDDDDPEDDVSLALMMKQKLSKRNELVHHKKVKRFRKNMKKNSRENLVSSVTAKELTLEYAESCSVVDKQKPEVNISPPIQKDSTTEIQAGKKAKSVVLKSQTRDQIKKLTPAVKDDGNVEDKQMVSKSLLPLRRSRRGKSDYIAPIPVTEDQRKDAIPTAITVENKLPLTKKQLIFSKLMNEKKTQDLKLKDVANPKSVNVIDSDTFHGELILECESTQKTESDAQTISNDFTLNVNQMVHKTKKRKKDARKKLFLSSKCNTTPCNDKNIALSAMVEKDISTTFQKPSQGEEDLTVSSEIYITPIAGAKVQCDNFQINNDIATSNSDSTNLMIMENSKEIYIDLRMADNNFPVIFEKSAGNENHSNDFNLSPRNDSNMKEKRNTLKVKKKKSKTLNETNDCGLTTTLSESPVTSSNDELLSSKKSCDPDKINEQIENEVNKGNPSKSADFVYLSTNDEDCDSKCLKNIENETRKDTKSTKKIKKLSSLKLNPSKAVKSKRIINEGDFSVIEESCKTEATENVQSRDQPVINPSNVFLDEEIDRQDNLFSGKQQSIEVDNFDNETCKRHNKAEKSEKRLLKVKKGSLPKRKNEESSKIDDIFNIVVHRHDEIQETEVLSSKSGVMESTCNIDQKPIQIDNISDSDNGMGSLIHVKKTKSLKRKSNLLNHKRSKTKKQESLVKMLIETEDEKTKPNILSLTETNTAVSNDDVKIPELTTNKEISTDPIVNTDVYKSDLTNEMSYATRRTRSKSVMFKTVTATSPQDFDILVCDSGEYINNNGSLEGNQNETVQEVNEAINEEKSVPEPLKSPKVLKRKGNKQKKNEQTSKDTGDLNCEMDPPIEHDLESFSDVSNVVSEENTPKRGESLEDLDSDDSSKSDMPLTKYAQEISKKKSEKIGASLTIKCRNSKHSSSPSKIKIRRKTVAICGNLQSNKKTEETIEEQSKSDQFMESFGFFSERKPRKSNLLAAKKIFETFNITANDKDASYRDNDRLTRKNQSKETRKVMSTDDDNLPSCSFQVSTASKSDDESPPTKKKFTLDVKIKPKNTETYCNICKKEFRRPDNLIRHQFTLLHISNLSAIEMNLPPKTQENEPPNCLVVYRRHLENLKRLNELEGGNKLIELPSLSDILKMTNPEKYGPLTGYKVSGRDLSRDEALFYECCELLKDSYKNNRSKGEPSTSGLQTHKSYLIMGPKVNEDVDTLVEKDEDVDSITAKEILESEEVRNLENDLISGLTRAANVSTFNEEATVQEIEPVVGPYEFTSENELKVPDNRMSRYNNAKGLPIAIDSKKNKELDVTNIADQAKTMINEDENERNTAVPSTSGGILNGLDLFEDKFDKIKRKCRSQAAAAKNTNVPLESPNSGKPRKKTERKSGQKKDSSKHQRSVPTKGALKGFDGIKVSIPTSDIKLPAIIPTVSEDSPKKRKKLHSKKTSNLDIECGKSTAITKETSHTITPKHKVDVYEFMDEAEETDAFEFRPTTLSERLKSAIKDNLPCRSLEQSEDKDPDDTGTSVSDGDDFVYMSDDYLCSANETETENSLMSFELGNGSKVLTETRKINSMKRKDSIEKNAVMGKIFKNNAVRNERRNSSRESVYESTEKTNLDQLFDSLLEKDPTTSVDSDKIDVSCNEKVHDQHEPTPPLSSEPYQLSDSEAGVARQRARRKCTVGKQNILAETWSSESEQDINYGRRPNSVESVAPVVRKKKSKKVSSVPSASSSVKRNRHITFKDQDESRVMSPTGDKSGRKKRSRSEVAYYCSSAEEEDSHALVEQHGWIVGDSHKKLVTMLAHAKGRKRDDKRHFVE